MNNSELSEKYAEQLKTGKSFIYGIKDTVNPNQKQLEIAQQVETGVEQGTIDFNAVSLGWKNTTINRHWQGISTENLAKMGGNTVIGKSVSEAYAALFGGEIIPVSIKVDQYTKVTEPLLFKSNVIDPIHAGREGAKPMLNPQTGATIKHNGEEIYRRTSLAQGEYNPAVHGIKLSYDTVTAPVGSGVSVTNEVPAIA